MCGRGRPRFNHGAMVPDCALLAYGSGLQQGIFVVLDRRTAGASVNGHRHDIASPDPVLMLSVLGDEPLSRRQDSSPLSSRDRFGRASGSVAGSGLDFDENELFALKHHKIQLTGQAMPIFRDTGISAALQP